MERAPVIMTDEKGNRFELINDKYRRYIPKKRGPKGPRNFALPADIAARIDELYNNGNGSNPKDIARTLNFSYYKVLKYLRKVPV